MSRICGILPLDGAPLDRSALAAMGAQLAGPGCDRPQSRVAGGAGLALAAFRTGSEQLAGDGAALTFDDRSWIVADARLDGKDELRQALAAAGRDAARCDDAALILRAWHAWGEACVERLIGDFAFGIWDQPSRRFFCARDRLGVKSFFHARSGGSLVFSNTIRCVLAHPGVAGDVDEGSIADFLLFESLRDPAATAFSSVRRLPAAHCMVASADAVRCRAYWHPDQAVRVRYRKAGDYAEHFAEVLGRAVEDRLKGESRVAIQMSGGLDSTAVAACSKAALELCGRPYDLLAHTIGHEGLVPDDERRHAARAAAWLAIPLTHYAAHEHRLYDAEAYHTAYPEPFHAPEACSVFHACLAGAAQGSRVLLTGFDGDTVLDEPPGPYLRALWRERRLALLAREGGRRILRWNVRWPFRRAAADDPGPDYPAWLEPEFERRLALRERWNASAAVAIQRRGGVRPKAIAALGHLQSHPFYFERYDPAITGLALECRHPLFDLRVVELALSLPPSPWCTGKRVLREAMRGRLPEAVRLRPKTPLAGRPDLAMMARDGAATWQRFAPSAALAAYVDVARLRGEAARANPARTWVNLRAVTLDRWLRRWQSPTRTHRSVMHEIA